MVPRALVRSNSVVEFVPVTLLEGVIGQTGSHFVSGGCGVDLGSWCCGVLVILGMMLWCYG